MPCYLIANYSITNAEGYSAYPPAVAPTLEPFEGQLVVADFSSEVIEGEPRPVSIVVKFPSREAAKGWYDSEAYQAVIGLRINNTEGSLVFVDGLL